AVSLIKAGAEIIGRPAGSVRAPLEMPNAEERERLATLVETAKGY
ncbi:5-dehydro-4-deoxyglucarate dehydratase, partial [Halomonas sp. ND22Bw]